MFLATGGVLVVSRSSFRGNSAGLFGGGVSLGSGQGSGTCALQLLAGTSFTDNASGHGGAQVSMGCAGDMLVQGTTMALTSVGTQVRPGDRS